MLIANAPDHGLHALQAESPEQIASVRELFLEYAQSLGFSLCFQSFDEELAGLPGDYAPPEGRLLLATYDSQPAGCVALHKLDSRSCEMKRLYVRPQFRGKGLGKALTERIINEARPRLLCIECSAFARSPPIAPTQSKARSIWNCNCDERNLHEIHFCLLPDARARNPLVLCSFERSYL